MKKVRPFVWLSEDWVIRLSVVIFRNAAVDIRSIILREDMFDVIANRGGTLENGTKYFLDGNWDLVIAHPPCTFLAVSGSFTNKIVFKLLNLVVYLFLH